MHIGNKNENKKMNKKISDSLLSCSITSRYAERNHKED